MAVQNRLNWLVSLEGNRPDNYFRTCVCLEKITCTCIYVSYCTDRIEMPSAISLVFSAGVPFASTTPRTSIYTERLLTSIITASGSLQVHEHGDPQIPASIHARPFFRALGSNGNAAP